MANLTAPKITVAFTELGISAINRGTKGIVAIILRDEAEVAPVAIAQANNIPGTLSAENMGYVKRAFMGYVNPPRKVLLYTLPAGGELTDALSWLETQDFDYLVGPADCSASDAADIASWVKSQRENAGAKFKAVLPNHNADHYSVVNFAAENLKAGDETYTTAQYCSRIAGLLAGTPMKISATYAPLPELTDVKRLTREEQDEAVTAGKLILVWDGRKVKVSRSVNSLVTTSEGMLDSFKKIKIVEIMDMIRTDIVATAEDSYIGKYSNSYDNKMLLVTAVRGYFEGLRQDDLVQSGYTVDIDVDAQEQYLLSRGMDTGEMSELEIKQADTGTHVFLKVACKILDAIEDIRIDIQI